MINEKAYILGSQRSCIRELFEYGRQRAAKVGKDKICDFSLGNPSVAPPEKLKQEFINLLENESPLDVHGYTSAVGCDEIRVAIASSLSAKYDMKIKPSDLYITCGAAAALTSAFGALTIDENTEFIAIAPFFPEYRCFAEIAGGKLKVVPADETNFQIRFDELEKLINANTQAIIINSPNNPSGTIYSSQTIEKLSSLLTAKSKEFGKTIYIISDEPYRELVYTGVDVPFVPKYYKDTIVCYSFSKKLSVPGERIGYVLVTENVTDHDLVFCAVAGQARKSGYVCAPSAMQRVIARCIDVAPDLTVYKKNRDLLYNSLTEMGYFCAEPDGAFYLFVKSPEGDGDAFSERAKQNDVLVVPGAGFGCPSFIRISYCVDTDVCERALPVFKKLIKDFN